MDRHSPFAAPSAALCVSSDRWAEASKPVIVYWVSRKPSGRTMNQKNMPLVSPPASPAELFTRMVKTSATLMCVGGRKTRMRITAAAPNTCHQTETLFMTAMRCPLKMFRTDTRIRITMNMRKTRFSE